MIAPSEKHLEDWIVDYPDDVLWQPDETYDWVKILKRQIKLPSGVADLIAFHICDVVVIELKKGKIDSQALSQLLRYMADLKDIWSCAIAAKGTPDPEPQYDSPYLKPHITGLLIGHSVDGSLVRSARGANVDVMLYDFSDDEYTFSDVPMPYAFCPNFDTFWEYSEGIIGDAMRESYLTYLGWRYTEAEIAAMVTRG